MLCHTALLVPVFQWVFWLQCNRLHQPHNIQPGLHVLANHGGGRGRSGPASPGAAGEESVLQPGTLLSALHETHVLAHHSGCLLSERRRVLCGLLGKIEVGSGL